MRKYVLLGALIVLGGVTASAVADFPHNWSNHGYPGWVTDGPISVPGTNEFTISTHDMCTWDLFPGGDFTGYTDRDPNAPGIGVDMGPAINNADFTFSLNDNAGWRAVQLGWSMFDPAPNYDDDTLPKEFYDVSDFDSYTISFHNHSFSGGQTALNANLFMNIGWTDIGETDLFVQNTWTLAEYCHNVVLEMDFTKVEAWENGAYLGWIDISNDPRLAHVSSIGVQIGSDSYPGDPAEVLVCLDTIPAPSAVLLGWIGLLVIGWTRRRLT
jgi:hypothetical protein